MKNYSVLLLLCFLVGCAKGRFDVINTNGKVVGECSAHFDWHWYGAQDSVNYILNLCAQKYLAKGYTISDESILANEYSLPLPPRGNSWNKKNAKEQFHTDKISEKKYGYILASIEYKFVLKMELLTKKLAQHLISKKEYEQTVAKAKIELNGI